MSDNYIQIDTQLPKIDWIGRFVMSIDYLDISSLFSPKVTRFWHYFLPVFLLVQIVRHF